MCRDRARARTHRVPRARDRVRPAPSSPRSATACRRPSRAAKGTAAARRRAPRAAPDRGRPERADAGVPESRASLLRHRGHGAYDGGSAANATVTPLAFHREGHISVDLSYCGVAWAGGASCTALPSTTCALCSNSCWMPASWRSCRAYKEFSMELAAAVLDEADRFASGVLAPLNQQGDRVGATLDPQGRTDAAPGFARGLPAVRRRRLAATGHRHRNSAARARRSRWSSAVEEIWYGANMALMLCPMLSRGAIEALLLVGSHAAAENLSAAHDHRKLVRHHGADRIAGRLGPRRRYARVPRRRAITTCSPARRSSSATAITI